MKNVTFKSLTLAISLVCLGFTNTANAKPSGNLNITVSGIKKKQGNIILAVYDNAKAFNKSSVEVHSLISVKPNGNTQKISLKNFPKGRYAVTVMHDSNGNGVMDFDKNQIPTEAYAYSKNVGKTKKPNFNQADFTHKNGTNLNLKLVHPL